MNNYTGVRVVGFLSVVLGSATFGVCGWIFFTYGIRSSNPLTCVLPTSTVSKLLEATPSSSKFGSELPLPVVCNSYLAAFVEMLVRNSFIAASTSVTQVVLSTYLMASTAQETIRRTKNWTVANIAFNLIYVLCFSIIYTYPIPLELGRRNAALALSKIEYLSSYYLILGLDIFVGFLMLISAMLMVRVHNKFGYALVANV